MGYISNLITLKTTVQSILIDLMIMKHITYENTLSTAGVKRMKYRPTPDAA